jgi:hypothetical protein
MLSYLKSQFFKNSKKLDKGREQPLNITTRKYFFLAVVAFSWYSGALSNLEECAAKILKIYQENIERDSKEWSQETLNELHACLARISHSDDFLKFKRYPLHLIIAFAQQRYSLDIENILEELITLKHPLINVNHVDEQGDSLLHKLVELRYVKIFDFLESHSDINFELKDARKRTPFTKSAELVAMCHKQMESSILMEHEAEVLKGKLTRAQKAFKALLLRESMLDLKNLDVLLAIRITFIEFPLYEAIIMGDIERVKLRIALGFDSSAAFFVSQDSCWLRSAFEYAVALGHYNIVNLLTSDDELLKDMRAEEAIKRSCIIVENILARLKFMLEQPKLTDETRKLYQERKENYEAIRSRLRATLMLPLELLREYCDEQRTDRIARFNMLNELLYLIGFFLFDTWSFDYLFKNIR